jgi:HD-GYP domain-containing protein (c-di-GMP phosphodiesterase class II)/DNA-binding CsgD family transcriptional regulator
MFPLMAQQVRLAELLGSLSFAGDLGRGQPMGHVLRTCRIAMALAEDAGLSQEEKSAVYFTALLVHAGCTAGSADFAAFLAGDELRAQKDFCLCDPTNMRELFGWLGRNVSPGRALPARTLRMLQLMAGGEKAFKEIDEGCSEVGSRIAARFGLSLDTQKSLYNICETWNGKGPHGLKGAAIPLPARMVNVAMITEVFFSERGLAAARAAALARAGKLFDPELGAAAGALCQEGPFWSGMQEREPWDTVLALEPGPPRYVDESNLDDFALALADIVDLKSNTTAVHSRRTGELADAVARRMRLSDSDVALTRRAGLVHDAGLVAVSSFLLGRAASWSEVEFESYRLHPYYTERILSRSPVLKPVGALAASHHEALDGSGFHGGLDAASLSQAARILAAVVAFQEKAGSSPADVEVEPHLKAMSHDVRLDGDAVSALAVELGAASPVPPKREVWPAGLTDREVEVLRLLATGLKIKRIADHLVISAHTARHHVESIYSKAGVASRAGAVLFAVDNQLIR